MSKILDQLNKIQDNSTAPAIREKKVFCKATPQNWWQKMIFIKKNKIRIIYFIVFTIGLSLGLEYRKKNLVTPPTVSVQPDFQKVISSDIQQASLLMKNNNYKQAALIWSRLKNTLKTNSTVLINLAFAQKKLKHYQLAYTNLNKALTLEPKNSAILNNLGMLDLETKRFSFAVSNFKKALIKKPNSPEINLNIASAYEALEKNKLALKHYKIFYKMSLPSKKTEIVKERIYQLSLLQQQEGGKNND